MGARARAGHSAVNIFPRRVSQWAVPLDPRTAVFAALIAFSLFLAALALRMAGRDLLDAPLLALLGHFAHRSVVFDLAIHAINRFDLFQGVPLFGLAYAAFASEQDSVRRVKVVYGCIAAAAAAILSRLLQLGLPHLPRPLFDPSQPFTAPYGDYKTLADWSSFPSDHAALLFGVAIAVAAGNRVLGAIALALATLVSFSRVYGGLHYPTDVIGGALLAAACVAASASAPTASYAGVIDKAGRHRTLLVGLAFMAATEASALFDDVRGVASELWKHLR